MQRHSRVVPGLRNLASILILLVAPAFAAAQSAARATTLDDALGKEIAAFVASDRASPPAPCQILFVGSSSIRIWRTVSADMAPLPVINRGFGGSHIEHVNRWFDQVVAPYHPRSIVFYAGENDLAAGKSAHQVIDDFDAFMARKSQVLGKTPVYFISVKPSKLRFAQLETQKQVNDAIRARADARADLRYVDVVPPMLENGTPKDIFIADGLHMTSAGYAIWTPIVKAPLLLHAEDEAEACRRSLPH